MYRFKSQNQNSWSVAVPQLHLSALLGHPGDLEQELQTPSHPIFYVQVRDTEVQKISVQIVKGFWEKTENVK